MTKLTFTPSTAPYEPAPVNAEAVKRMAIVDAMSQATRAKVHEFGLDSVSRHRTTRAAYQAAKKKAGIKGPMQFVQRAAAVAKAT